MMKDDLQQYQNDCQLNLRKNVLNKSLPKKKGCPELQFAKFTNKIGREQQFAKKIENLQIYKKDLSRG